MDKPEFHFSPCLSLSFLPPFFPMDENVTWTTMLEKILDVESFLGSKTELYGSNKVFWVLLRVNFSTALFSLASYFHRGKGSKKWMGLT